jgi:uracil-DNA glycosylase
MLKDAFIAAAVRCAPPDNKPTPEEIGACQRHLVAELDELSNIRVVVALGKIAFDVWWRILALKGIDVRPRPPFSHGAVFCPGASPVVIASYHPSRQNTNTGKLTPAMMRTIFKKAKKFATEA